MAKQDVGTGLWASIRARIDQNFTELYSGKEDKGVAAQLLSGVTALINGKENAGVAATLIDSLKSELLTDNVLNEDILPSSLVRQSQLLSAINDLRTELQSTGAFEINAPTNLSASDITENTAMLTFDDNNQSLGHTCKIVVLGSSTAEGRDATPETEAVISKLKTYGLANYPNFVMSNRAQGNQTSYHLMPNGTSVPNRPSPATTRNVTYAIAQNPDIVLINIPTNDTNNGYTNEEYLSNIATITGLLTAAGIKWFVTTTQPRNVETIKRQNLKILADQMKEIYGANCLDWYYPVTDLATLGIKNVLNSGDGVHLNTAGHLELYNATLSALFGYIESTVKVSKHIVEQSINNVWVAINSDLGRFVDSYTVTGLNPNTPYSFRIGAVNKVNLLKKYTEAITIQTLGVGVVAPSSLVYQSPNIFTQNVPITAKNPSVVGTVVSYSVSPSLPAGLSLNTSTGVITGTPTDLSPATNYKITATNGAGSTTFIISIGVAAVVVAPTGLSYTSPVSLVEDSPIVPLNPSVSGSPTSFAVEPPLPFGLSLNASTGVISGTPTTPTVMADYTVTATNTAGNTTSIIELEITEAVIIGTQKRIILNMAGTSDDNTAPFVVALANINATPATWVSNPKDINGDIVSGFSIIGNKPPKGSQGNGSTTSGLTANVGEYPLGLVEDAIYIYGGVGTVQLDITVPEGFTGVAKFWGSKMTTGTNPLSMRKLGDETWQSVTTSNNIDFNQALFFDLVPGVNVLEMARLSSSSGFAYLNVVDIVLTSI